MYKKLVCILVLGFSLVSGVLLGRYNPELFTIPFSYMKSILVNGMFRPLPIKNLYIGLKIILIKVLVVVKIKGIHFL